MANQLDVASKIKYFLNKINLCEWQNLWHANDTSIPPPYSEEFIEIYSQSLDRLIEYLSRPKNTKYIKAAIFREVYLSECLQDLEYYFESIIKEFERGDFSKVNLFRVFFLDRALEIHSKACKKELTKLICSLANLEFNHTQVNTQVMRENYHRCVKFNLIEKIHEDEVKNFTSLTQLHSLQLYVIKKMHSF